MISPIIIVVLVVLLVFSLFQPRTKVYVRQLGDDQFSAQIAGTPQICYGSSDSQAIGSLVKRNPDRFRVVVLNYNPDDHNSGNYNPDDKEE